MKTTFSSSAEYNPEYLALSPAFRALIDARLDMAQRYAEQKARQDAHADRMRKAKDEPKEALCQRFITQHRAALLARQPCFRCSFLRGRMEAAQLRGECFEIPDDRLIRKCLRNTDTLIKSVATDESERSSV